MTLYFGISHCGIIPEETAGINHRSCAQKLTNSAQPTRNQFSNFRMGGFGLYKDSARAEVKFEIANVRKQVAIGGNEQIGNSGEEVATEPQPIKGPPGMKGETGAQGAKGEKGNVGSYGMPGLNGTHGQRGLKGKSGIQGIKGQMGAKGLKGEMGPKGIKGDAGLKGARGLQGMKGANGIVGQDGLKGTKGQQGAAGIQGPKGLKGARGIQGPKGYAGDVGGTGAKGDKGQKGDSDFIAILEQKYALQQLRVRLVNGGYYYGRVEVYHNGIWGTVCDDDWDISDATVFCRMLGYQGAKYAWIRAHYGRGSGQIWLTNIHCSGSESNIDDCSKSSWGTHSCHHGQDVSTQCIT